MKISNEPTPYLLLKAGTDSAWDCCDFAIVYLSKEWRQTQSGRLEAVKPFKVISAMAMRFVKSASVIQPWEDISSMMRGIMEVPPKLVKPIFANAAKS